jgi:hypothetical protein
MRVLAHLLGGLIDLNTEPAAWLARRSAGCRASLPAVRSLMDQEKGQPGSPAALPVPPPETLM